MERHKFLMNRLLLDKEMANLHRSPMHKRDVLWCGNICCALLPRPLTGQTNDQPSTRPLAHDKNACRFPFKWHSSFPAACGPTSPRNWSVRNGDSLVRRPIYLCARLVSSLQLILNKYVSRQIQKSQPL